MTSIDLHSSVFGDAGRPVVFCHGLFGQGKNWTQAAKSIADRHRALLIDMPNHGRSGWTEGFDYPQLASLVAAEISDHFGDEPVALVGHSMGGKIAMTLALHHPEQVERLCVVDVAPVPYSNSEEFDRYLTAMRAMDLDALERREDADAALTETVPNPTVRSFLLQNLRREGDGWRWQPNLALLQNELAAIASWDVTEGEQPAPYDGPVLWIGGAESPYITDEGVAAMDALFPRNRRVTVKAAGHWVHSEQPEVFAEVLARFVDDEMRDRRGR